MKAIHDGAVSVHAVCDFELENKGTFFHLYDVLRVDFLGCVDLRWVLTEDDRGSVLERRLKEVYRAVVCEGIFAVVGLLLAELKAVGFKLLHIKDFDLLDF